MRKLNFWQKPVFTNFLANRKQELSAVEETKREVCLTPAYRFCTAVYFLTTSVSILLLVFSSLVFAVSRPLILVAAVFQTACATIIHKMSAAAVIRR